MSNLHAPFRYDYVGSFLRPEELKKARLDYAENLIVKDELKSIEDQCITSLIGKIKELGYPVITDGEFRRQAWHLDFMWGLDGVSHQKTESGLPFHDEQAMIDDTFLIGKVGLSNEHPFIDHYRFVKQFEDDHTVSKLTVPSPAQTLAQFWMPFGRAVTLNYYDNADDLCHDIAEAYKTFVRQLYAAGCRNLQFDDCTWGMMADATGPMFFGVEPEDLIKVMNRHKDINNAVIEAAPDDMVVNTHICRGNYHSTYANSGPYDGVADVIFAGENVNAYYLEFDDARSGGFAPLAKVSPDKKVVLGLITTKSPKLENKELVAQRIKQASNYVPLERLYLSPQCGFASCEIGNKLTEDEQWAKLKLVKEIAETVWPETC